MVAFTVTAPGFFDDRELKPLLDAYRQDVAQRYTSCPPTEIQRMIAAPPFHVSRKIDGELWYLVADTSGPRLVSANGRVASGECEVLAAAATIPAGTVVAGELYVAKADARERVGDVRAALVAGGSGLIFGAFDLIRSEDVTWREAAYPARLEILNGLFPTTGTVHVIPVTTTESEADVVGLYQDAVEKAGAEGIVVRCSDGRALKIKPEITLDLVVLGYTSRDVAEGSSEARSLLIGLAADEGLFVPLGTVGNLAEGVNRTTLLDRLRTLDAPSQYRRAASTGQLYQMVRPEVIVECRVLDVQVEDSKERPIRQPELRLTNGEWTVTGQAPAPTLLNPLLLRLRDDKADVEGGARWAQIEQYVAAPCAATAAGQASEVIRRQVWTKTAKDKTDVRKLVVWKTNKDTDDPSYPAYVVHWTDYSAGRKAPLTREVRPVITEDAAQAAAEDLIADNIKKGWELRE